MKLTDNLLPAAQTSGDMVTLNMGISDDPEDQLMILNVLSATLYTDKLAAPLREYGCNAFDANVEAGKGDVPFEVGLPNKLEPSLRIRDFGFGMTEEQIANTFVKLGKSSKRHSNEFTGMLGIGSKAGFAYGDSFMVTSFIGGRKVVYNAFRDKGRPCLANMHTAATTEPDGIEIKVPVRMEHFEEFRQKAERIYRYFRVRPKITGASVEFQDAERLMSGTGWHYTGRGYSVAIMGNVGYDLHAPGMGHALGHAERELLNLGVELEFKIGELKMTASREGLEYTDLTKHAVRARLSVLVSEVSDTFTKQVAGATCLWEACKHYGDIFERLGNSNTRSLKEIVVGQVKWRGKVINTGRFCIENKEADPEVNVFRVYKHQYSSRWQREAGAHTCYASHKTVLVINDLPHKKQSPSRERGFLDDPANAAINEWVLFTFQSDAAQQCYWKARELDGAPTINLSSITPAVTATTTSSGPRTHNSKHSSKVFVLDETAQGDYKRPRSEFWKQETVNINKDGGSYVILDSFYVYPKAAPGPEHPITFLEKIALIRKAGLITGPVYGFKRSRVAGGIGPGWMSLQDSIKQKLDTELQTLAQETADFVAASQHTAIAPVGHAALFPVGTSIRNLLELIIKLRTPAQAAMMQAILNQKKMAPWVLEVKLPAPSVQLDILTTDVLKEYPMLNVMMISLRNFGPTSIQIVADYIRLVESAKPNKAQKKP